MRTLLAAVLFATSLAGQESRARAVDVPKLDGGRYFLIPPREEPGERGAGLCVVLPGGDGSADFLPFVEHGIGGAAPPDWAVAMVTAVKWTDDQEVVWPTKRLRAKGMKFTTEELVLATVADAARQTKIDPARVFLLAWSSSGPAAYDLALAPKTAFKGFYVAMSVFKPERAALARAKGRRFVLDQSPDDRVTPFRFATDARDALTERGAAVWLRTYAGGHGWNDAPIPRLRDGLRWLATEDPAPAAGGATPPKDGANLLTNGGFEQGTAGWTVLDNSGSTRAAADTDEKREGERSLHLTKTGATPLDLVRQDVDLTGEQRVEVSALVRCAGAKNAFVKFFVYGDGDEPLLEDVDLVQLRGDRDWQRVARTWELPKGSRRGTIMVVMVLGGDVWVDDARVVALR